MRPGAFGLVMAAALAPAEAHSWVERLMRIAPNGTMVGIPGYARGQVRRGTANEDDVTGLIPPNDAAHGGRILKTDKIARTVQTTVNYSDTYPMLNAAPGDWVALQYQENGHVSLPSNQVNKTLNRGTVYIYGTTQNDLSNTNFVDVHLRWNTNGTGGDAKGRLLATRNFDDGQCHQTNDGPIASERNATFYKMPSDPMGQDLWCQSDVQVPLNLTVGTVYTVLWVWDWPSLSQANVSVPPLYIPGFGNASADSAAHTVIAEYYVSVMDINIVDQCDVTLGSVKGRGCSASRTSSSKAFSANSMKFQDQSVDYSIASIEEQLQSHFLVQVDQGSASEDLSDIPAESVNNATGSIPSSTNEANETTNIYVERITVTIPVATVTVTTIVDGDTPADGPVPTPTTPSVSAFLRRRRGHETVLEKEVLL